MAERNVKPNHRLGAERHRGDAERREGVLRLSGFDVVYLRDEMTAVIPGQTIAVDPQAVEGFRPTYRLLSYCLASNGFPVRNDLAGVDRPDLVNALTDEVYSWAGLTPAAARRNTSTRTIRSS
jgi:hypothetical protein